MHIYTAFQIVFSSRLVMSPKSHSLYISTDIFFSSPSSLSVSFTFIASIAFESQSTRSYRTSIISSTRACKRRAKHTIGGSGFAEGTGSKPVCRTDSSIASTADWARSSSPSPPSNSSSNQPRARLVRPFLWPHISPGRWITPG